MTALEPFRAAFDASLEQGPAWLQPLRRAAYQRFLELGLPTTHQEAWKYTSLAPIARTTFAAPPRHAAVTLDDLKPLTFGALGRHRVVFVDGRLTPSLSTLDTLPEGVTVEAARVNLPDKEQARVDGADWRTPFEALNSALSADPTLLAIAPGKVVEEPLYLYFYVTRTDADPSAVAVHSEIVADRGSQSKVVEAYGGAAGARYFTSALTGVAVADGAILDRVRLQRESTEAFHVGRLHVLQARGARFSDHSINLGAALHRHDIDVEFDGEGGECSLDGLFMATGEQHTDTHTLIDHARPRCTSRELYKGVLDGKSRGVFHGRILVRKDAQKTDAHQANKNLLLSREALVNSTPQLEILADDVKCKHGSTTGQLDATALFYLRSRGISETAARSLLTYAFASDVVKRIPVDDVRAGLETYLQARLPVQEAEEALA